MANPIVRRSDATRRVAIAVLTAVLALAATGSVAFAGQPTIERVAVDVDARLNATSEICGFEVWQHVSGTLIVQTRTDGSGMVTERDITPGTFQSVFYSRDANGVPTGKRLVAHSAGTQTISISPDGSFVYRESGSHDRITIPGSGVIFGSIGHLVDIFDAATGEETVKVAGTHQITFESLANLCDPLRPVG